VAQLTPEKSVSTVIHLREFENHFDRNHCAGRYLCIYQRLLQCAVPEELRINLEQRMA